MKLHGLTPAVFLISSAESAEAFTLLRSSSYGRPVRRIHPRAHTWGLLRRRIKARLGITPADIERFERLELSIAVERLERASVL